MPDTPIDTAATGIEPTFDRQAVLESTMRALARLEKMYEAACRKLRTAKTAEELVQQILAPKRALLQRMFSIGIMPEDMADLFAQDMADKGMTLSSAKLLKALRKFGEQSAGNSGIQTTGKKRGRKSNAEKAAIEAAAQTITAAKFNRNSGDSEPGIAGNSVPIAPKNSPKSAAKRPLSSAPVATPQAASPPQFKKESDERKERMRRELPDWVARYQDDKKYAAAVQRREGESDIDYCWRMWHTRAPWDAEVNLPIWPNQTETEHIAGAWDEKSPEERAAYRASLPPSARR